jgi:C-terminal processing protease CtpA/Prc
MTIAIAAHPATRNRMGAEIGESMPECNPGRPGQDRILVFAKGSFMRIMTRLLIGSACVLTVVFVYAQTQKPEPLPAVLADDREFAGGSGIALEKLTPVQVANLALLGKVWGFLKYHHPLITQGKKHWDRELLRIIPQVLKAGDAAAARSVVNQWTKNLGAVPACTQCTSLDERELHLKPPITWLTDDILGAELGGTLRDVHRNRPSDPRQFYVSLTANVGNPSFDHELAYEKLSLPDAGFQLLALFRLWNIVEYWFPYRDLLEGKWDDELEGFIPRIALAKDSDSYKRELMAFIAGIHDTHANLWSSLDARPPVGPCWIPSVIRFVENQAVVTGPFPSDAAASSGLRRGDIVTALDGVPVAELVKQWSPYYAASNEPTRRRDIARSMTRGKCGSASVRVTRDNQTVDVAVERTPEPAPTATGSMARRTHDRPGDTFQKLSPEVAYLKLSTVRGADVLQYIESAAGTKGLIIDIRNYPAEFVVFTLGTRLVDKPSPFARFTIGDTTNPGAFRWSQPISLNPAVPRYTGKIVILIDETSQSQSEYTTMAFRTAPGATVVGSTTAGADGNVSPIPLPGGLRSMISGIGVFYPDKKPTQRIGIIPDVEARPTIQGIRNGRDEVLEAGIRQILGPGAAAADIEHMAKR